METALNVARVWNLVQMKLLSCSSRADLGHFKNPCLLFVWQHGCFSGLHLKRKIQENDLLSLKKTKATREESL